MAANAPAMTGVHCKYFGSAACGPETVSKVMSADPSAGRRRTAFHSSPNSLICGISIRAGSIAWRGSVSSRTLSSTWRSSCSCRC
jgi:hypothetical protein